MKLTITRRTSLVAAAAALVATALVGCGAGSVFSALVPSRVVVFGDGFSDVGQTGSRYTVNDGSVNIWAQKMAANYSLGLTAQSAGGTGWARGNARVSQKPDAAGVATTLTVTEQIDGFLAGGAIGVNDITVISGGTSDLVVQTNAYKAGTITKAQMLVNVAQAATDLAAQVKRLVAAGGKHVVLVGTYNLGKSPYAIGLSETALLAEASTKFNDTVLTAVVNEGANVLYVDAAYYYNLLANQPATYNLDLATVGTAVCTTPNASTCTPSTLVASANYSRYLFADGVHFTPVAQSLFGDYAYGRMKTRW